MVVCHQRYGVRCDDERIPSQRASTSTVEDCGITYSRGESDRLAYPNTELEGVTASLKKLSLVLESRELL